MNPAATLPPALADAALRQACAFFAGDPAFLDWLGELFVDEGHHAVRGREAVRRSFLPTLAGRSREAQGRTLRLRIVGWLTVGQADARPAWTATQPNLLGTLRFLETDDRLVWLAPEADATDARAFFNAYRLDDGRWRVIAYGADRLPARETAAAR